ncbi:hypothetical protein H4S08_001856, partial [Coemansia sp. RSA 1365]
NTKALLKRNEKDPRVWSPVLNVQSALLKNKGDRKFVGSIFTDGVSVYVVHKSDAAVEKCRKQYKKRNITADPASDSDSAPAPAPVSVPASVPASGTNPKPQKKRKSKADKLKEFSYNHEMETAELIATEGRGVLTDPGRGDLLYCMSEMSTPADHCVYRVLRKNKQK